MDAKPERPTRDAESAGQRGERRVGERGVGEIMTREVVTIQIGDHASLADTLMKNHPIHHLPVLEGRVLRGIISQSDLYRNMLSFFFVDTEREQHEFLDEFLDIPSIMTREPITLTEGDTVAEALALMLERRIGSIPIVDGRNELLGILTDSDILAAVRAGGG